MLFTLVLALHFNLSDVTFYNWFFFVDQKGMKKPVRGGSFLLRCIFRFPKFLIPQYIDSGIYIYNIVIYQFKYLLFTVVLPLLLVFDQIWLIIYYFFVGKTTIKKPVAGRSFLWHVFFDNSTFADLYFWYHNILIQL